MTKFNTSSGWKKLVSQRQKTLKTKSPMPPCAICMYLTDTLNPHVMETKPNWYSEAQSRKKARHHGILEIWVTVPLLGRIRCRFGCI
jgi:hypothetical protein